MAQGPVLACSVVYAEVVAAFPQPEDAGLFFQDVGVDLDPVLDRTALVLAAAAWRAYRRIREQGLTCPACGTKIDARCPRCGERIAPRQHMVADFLIAGHAEARGARLLTRDRGFYRQYFPKLEVLAPEAGT